MSPAKFTHSVKIVNTKSSINKFNHEDELASLSKLEINFSRWEDNYENSIPLGQLFVDTKLLISK